MADHFEDVEARLSAVGTRADAEEQSVKEHFAELQRFITFSLTRQTEELRKELTGEIGRVEGRMDRFDRRMDGLEQQFDALDRKFDAHHDAIKLILRDILSRLPTTPA